jgi:hypothetical protein
MAADDLYDNVKALPAIRPDIARLNGSVNGPTVDRRVGRVFFRSVMFMVQSGAITDGSHVVNVQESANGSAWTDVPAADIRGGEPTILLANDNAAYEFAYTGNARYLRLQLTTTGATVGGFVDGVCLLGIQAIPR